MNGKFLSGICLALAAAVLIILQFVVNNVMLFLTAGWFATIAIVHLTSGTIRLFGRSDSVANRMLANRIEVATITGAMTAFSIVSFFAWHDHWFLLVHGI